MIRKVKVERVHNFVCSEFVPFLFSVEDIPDHRETRVYDENFPIGSSAKVVLRDR